MVILILFKLVVKGKLSSLLHTFLTEWEEQRRTISSFGRSQIWNINCKGLPVLSLVTYPSSFILAATFFVSFWAIYADSFSSPLELLCSLLSQSFWKCSFLPEQSLFSLSVSVTPIYFQIWSFSGKMFQDFTSRILLNSLWSGCSGSFIVVAVPDIVWLQAFLILIC